MKNLPVVRHLSCVWLLVLLLLTTPVVAQLDEGEPYFSLTTERTFGSGEKPKVRLWGRGIRKLQFRVYRVRDVARFFRELEEPNHFGGEPHRTPGSLTLLERYHRWKSSSRASMRNLVRKQYTPAARVTIREAIAEHHASTRKTSALEQYADVPVLNRQQLVSVWEQGFQTAQPWEAQIIAIDVSDRGVYLVEATDGQRQAYTIVCLTDLILLTKTGEGDILARTIDRKSGKPVAGAEISGFMRRREAIHTASDATGFASIRPPAAKTGEAAEGLTLLARRGPDIAPVAVSSWELHDLDADSGLTAYAYTDRPVYRPGHQVHFKAILRRARSLGYELPRGGDVGVEMEDPDGKSIFRKSLRPNSNGSISGDLTLPATAALGYYSISVRSGDQYAGNAGFQVEEYRKPEYEVRVTPAAVRVLQGETVHATINARYYFGEPVPNAKVTYVVHRSRYWLSYYEQDIDDETAPPEGDDEYLGNEQILEESGTLDSDGKLDIQFSAEKAAHDLRYRIEARVTDQANREVSGTGYAVATRAPFFIHAEPDRYVYESGEQAGIHVESRDYNGNAVPQVSFEVRLYAGDKDDRVLTTVSGRTDDHGIGSASLKVTSGNLHARVLAKDKDGRETDDVVWLWVGGGGWDWGRRQRVELVPDKKSYKSGDTAHVLVVTGVPDASVWITAESRTVIFSKLLDVHGSTASFDVPIRGEYSPNIFINATFVRDGQLYVGSKSLKVPPTDQKLNVSVHASKPQFRPGEKGTLTLEAKDSTGKPVNAEFSVGVVDEAIYGIRKEAAQDMRSFFYGRRYNSVHTSSSMHYSFSGASGKRRMQLTKLASARLAQIKPEKFVDPRVRKAFPDTIYWVADARTGPGGRVEIPVEFPDALTTWRTTARGITPDTHVGSAVDRAIVRKNLILRMTVPRFFMQGDEVAIAAIVQNYLTSEKKVRVSLEAKGVQLLEASTQDVVIAPRGTAQVFYRVKADNPGSAVLLGKALTDEESDALELTVPVNPYGVKLSDARTGVLEAASEAETELAFPADANPSSRMLEVSVTPSVAGNIFAALDYLTTFPYGCTEQTMSSFLPNIIVARATKDLGIKAGIEEADLTRKIRAGLDRLYNFQHEDGGWGWWQTDDSSVFMTAYVVAGLAQAQSAGYKLNPEVLDKAVTRLKSELPKQKHEQPDLRAYAVYALGLANATDSGLLESVWSKRSVLSSYGTALLGLALQAGKDKRSAELAGILEAKAKSTDREVWWDLSSDPLLEIPVDASAEATAFVMKFLSVEKPSSDLLPKAALYLVTHRDGGYYWSSTKQTAMVVYGLTDYLRITQELRPDLTVSVSVNGNSVGNRHFAAGDVMGPGLTLKVPADQVNASGNRIQISKSGTGHLYWTARTEYYSSAENLARGATNRLSVTREYFRLSPAQKGDKVVYHLEPLGESVTKGDIVAVRLKVSGTEWNYLLTEDPIPSGTEFITRDDLYDLDNKPEWWARWFSRREFHDNRMALFQRWFPSGESEQSYLLKVVNSGKFRVPPARVEPMYQPGIFAISNSRSMEVR